MRLARALRGVRMVRLLRQGGGSDGTGWAEDGPFGVGLVSCLSCLTSPTGGWVFFSCLVLFLFVGFDRGLDGQHFKNSVLLFQQG